ncbi:MAG: Wzz/FepE/Etk N-terminal domain-containing protein [Candidatus Uhrbacteria bacterium]
MPKNNYSLLSRGWKIILAFAFLGLVIALVVSFLQPLRYSSTVRLLILQDNAASLDAYTASRSTERLAENLSTIVYTTSFFDQVMNAGFDIDQTVFPDREDKKRKMWGKTVSASVSRGNGLLTITVYHTDPAQAEQISRAVAYVLTQQAWSYISGGSVSVREVDAPLNSRWIAQPNIPANGFSGLVLGGLAGVGYVLLQAERLRRRHQLVDEEI